jgi:isocitrate dehydrogenase
MEKHRIIYTLTDEAPALATYSLLPIVNAYCAPAGVVVETRDISLSGRILANFADRLLPEQRIDDALAELGALAKTPEANIIKLPNISASVPQLKAAIDELQSKGFAVPDYPEEPANAEEQEVADRYARVLGSAVNPVLREGNSDRRVAAPVKAYAQANPHRMGVWSADSRSRVLHMEHGDFYGSEQSHVMAGDATVRIEWVGPNGEVQALRETVSLLDGEVIDAAVMSRAALVEFFEQSIESAKAADVLLSLHLKATMMKVSDPIMFGHAVKAYYADVFDAYGDRLEALGVDPNNGIGDLYQRVISLPDEERAELEGAVRAVYGYRPRLAMVDSDRGITNLHVPSDVIIDASVPACLRSSGQMWGPDGELHDTFAMIPDRCYAGIYQAVFDDCRNHGAFDPTTMGNVSNVGLMAQKAEEYGSHDKTFEIESAGTVRVVGEDGAVLMEHAVEAGDIWRMCQTRDLPIRDWVRLAVSRARATGSTALFWLDPNRAHDANLIGKVRAYLPEHDTDGLDIRILSPVDAMGETLAGIRAGKDFISVTGNVLRDYLTDLFPILELGTSAKMLSIVPLLNGGGLYETGAGGSAPKHVQQFIAQNHLRWDSLGEFLALQVSLADLAEETENAAAAVLARALDTANARYLAEGRAPSRKSGELGTRGSHFYLALYWAEALAAQDEDAGLKARFAPVALALRDGADAIVDELNGIQGVAVDLGGYYRPDEHKAEAAMRPCAAFNDVLEALSRT